MSLINQVLKDLEQRHASEMAEATHNLDGLALASPVIRHARNRQWWWLSLVGLLIAASVVSVWWRQQSKPRQSLVPAVANTQTPIVPKAAAVAPMVSSQIKPARQHIAQSSKAPIVEKPHRVATQSANIAHVTVTKTPHQQAVTEEADGGMEKQMVPLRSEQKAELAYEAGYDQLQLHNMRRAEQQLRQALVIEPTHVRARELLAGVLIKQGRWIETADLMQQGVQVLPANVVFIKLYARTLMQLNRDPQAIKLLRDHAPPLAQDPDYFALLAALYQRQQDHLAAANTYSQILKLRPDTGIWWVGLGISLEALGKQQQAQQAYARARQTGTLRGDLARYTDNRLLALDAINYPID